MIKYNANEKGEIMVIELTPKDSITEAAKKLKSGDKLFLKKGIYNEKVEIFNNNISIIGENRDEVIIQNGDYFHKLLLDYNSCNTFRTYTMYLGGNNITLKDLTVKNLCNKSYIYGQSIALYNDSDNFLGEHIILDGGQDTLFTGPLPYFLRERHKNFLRPIFLRDYIAKQIYKDSIIKGDTDFIFGNATALFINCDLVSIETKAHHGIDGYISAPSHAIDQQYGYLFYKCNLRKEKGVKNVYLARPWGKYGTVAFIDCNLEEHINKEGFSIWVGKNRHQTCRFIEYGKYELKDRISWAHILDEKEKNAYVEAFLKNINYKH